MGGRRLRQDVCRLSRGPNEREASCALTRPPCVPRLRSIGAGLGPSHKHTPAETRPEIAL